MVTQGEGEGQIKSMGLTDIVHGYIQNKQQGFTV